MNQNTKSSTTRRTLSLKRADTPQLSERLHKVLAQAGLGSRRALEERIEQGQVQVNGEVASLGSCVASGDRVELDGRNFVVTGQSQAPRVLIYNKPEGEVTTRDDPEGRPTVFDRLPPIKGARWINVGRLDINTTGLLLLTTDGDLVHALTHPSSSISREYVCRIHGDPSEAELARLADNVELEDGPAKFAEIERIGASDSHAWFRVVLHEGRNREVRRLWEAVGYTVSRLKRVRYGNLHLPRELKRGQFQELTEAQVEQLREELNLGQGEQVLTLHPVIGQRRARSSEYRPAPREQRAWVHGSNHGDEARELRRFDRIREDSPRPGGRKGRGKRPGGHPVPDDIGNRLTAPGGRKPGKPTRRKAAAPGYENPNEHRTWYVPEGVTTTSRVAPPRQVGRPGRLFDPASKRGPAGGKPGAAAGPKGRGKPGPRGGGRPGHGTPRHNKPRG